VAVIPSANAATVTLSPTSATVNAGVSTPYYAAVTGSESQTVTWFVDGLAQGGASVGTLTPNGDGAHVLYTAPAAGGTHTLKAVATNAAGASATGATTITVLGTASSSAAPAITTQPKSTSVNAGQTATFTVVATGTATLNYQWSKNGTAVTGANSASYTTPAATPADSGSTFTVAVSNASGSVTSSSATLTVSAVQTGWAGFGKNVTGGAGKSVVHVTNLNDSGAGSFRAAVGSDRTIVFDVGGTIAIPASSSDIVFESVSNVTIDGSNAPAPGVSFAVRGINFRNSNNIIVTNIRHRGGFNNGAESGGCLTFFPACSNVVVDHCSFSGFQDEAIDFWHGNHDVTIQNCIVGAGMAGTGHNYECLIGFAPSNFTVYHNLFSAGEYRNPAIGYDDTGGTVSPGICADVINNVTWKYTAYGITVYWGAKANVTGNYLYTEAFPGDSNRAVNTAALGQSYASGNYSKDGSGVSGTESTPFAVPAYAQIAATSAADAAAYVKANAGCRVGGLDAVDLSILNDLTF
jgi:hypothetical protein